MRASITLIFAILLMGAVFASPDIEINKYSTGFSLLPYSLSDVCSCGTINDQYVIQNTGSFESTFTASNNVGLNQNFQTVKLKPGQQAILQITGGLACGEGELNYLVRVVSSRGASEEVSRVAEVGKCQNIQLSTDDTTDFGPGQTITKKVQVSNIGSFTETYVVKSKSLNQFLENSSYSVILDPKTSLEVEFTYLFPPELYGDYTFKFEGESITNELKAVIEDEFTINPDYDFSVKADEQTICTEINNAFSIEVENEGAVDNVYRIQKLSGRGYELEYEFIEVDAGESKTVTITPDKNSPVEENLRLKVSAEYGDQSTIIEIPINAINCYDLYVEVPQEINHCGGEKEYSILIKNTGILKQDIVVESNIGDLSDDEFSLNEGEEKLVDLNIRTADKTQITIGSALGTKTYDIPTKVEEYCSRPQVLKDSFVVRESQAQFLIPIKNTGIATGNYELNIDNDAELSESELEIAPGKTATVAVNIDLSEREFGSYAFNLEIEGETTTETTLSVEYLDRTLAHKGIDFLNTNPCLYVLGSTLFLAFVSLVLWVFIKPRGRGSIKITVIILALVLIITALGVYLVKGAPQPLHPELISEPADLYYEVYAGQTLTINLNQYFEDEDSDNLTYQVLGDDINYALKKGILTINDEAGEYEIYFEAFDGEDYTESPDMAIVIKNKQQIGFLQFIVKYCPWLAWLALVLAALFLLGFMIRLGGPAEKGNFEKPKFEEKKTSKKKTTKKVAKKTAKKKAVTKKTAKKAVTKKVAKKKPLRSDEKA